MQIKKEGKMMLKRAEYGDIEKLENYYRYVADNTENLYQYCRWIYGKHPTDDMIEEYIKNGNMYFAEEGDMVVVYRRKKSQKYNYVKYISQAYFGVIKSINATTIDLDCYSITKLKNTKIF